VEDTSADSAAPEPAPESKPPSPNALQAYDLLGRFLEEDAWHPERIEDRYAYRVRYNGKHGEYRCTAQVRVDLEQFVFYAVVGVKAPEEVRPAVAEFLARANYGLRVGNFEMDFADGEVRYKSSLDFEGELLTPNWLRHAIYPAVQTLDRYVPGLLKVAFGGRTPFEAIEEIEGA